ncbi:hypothetical protein E1A91_A12G130300v1 [Gossypium mustelinum]|uniref:Uncharacterized protein n=1 Tax=Gossypium mustelinum TaxID=34275 RepID=A0A5D2WTJ2_GOSMU|nr:hypothetical protein E1A91_A12G130300v1 [Gossypium mustelinum]
MAEEAAVASTPPQSSAPPLGSTVIPSQKESAFGSLELHRHQACFQFRRSNRSSLAY